MSLNLVSWCKNSSRKLGNSENRARLAGSGRDGGSPGGGVYVAGVLGKEPAMAFEVGDAVLQFSVDGFLKFFPNRRTVGFGVGVMCLDVRDNDGEHLRAEAELAGGFEAAFARAADHDVRVAEVELNAA